MEIQRVNLRISNIVPPLQMNVYKGNDYVISQVLQDWGIWERAGTQLSLKYIKSGFNVLDIGANIGYYTLLFSRCVGVTGCVYAFEPEPDNFCILQSNICLNQVANVVLSQSALSDEQGQAWLYKTKYNLGDHRLSYNQGAVPIRVDISTLDNVFSNQEININFVKIDTQGAEEKILRGMQKIIAKNTHYMTILIEFSPRLLILMSNDYLSFLSLLKELNARIMQFSIGYHGQLEFKSIGIKDLERIARHLLSTEFEDAGMDLLLFFSEQAERQFLLSQINSPSRYWLTIQ